MMGPGMGSDSITGLWDYESESTGGTETADATGTYYCGNSLEINEEDFAWLMAEDPFAERLRKQREREARRQHSRRFKV